MPRDRANLDPPQPRAVMNPLEIGGFSVALGDLGDRRNDRPNGRRLQHPDGGRFDEVTPAIEPAIGCDPLRHQEFAAALDRLHQGLRQTRDRVLRERNAGHSRPHHVLDDHGHRDGTSVTLMLADDATAGMLAERTTPTTASTSASRPLTFRNEANCPAYDVAPPSSTFADDRTA